MPKLDKKAAAAVAGDLDVSMRPCAGRGKILFHALSDIEIPASFQIAPELSATDALTRRRRAMNGDKGPGEG